ncbi:MAG TPA: arginine--tRNA ligase [Candidatus Paceibacterota bacterium]
MDMQTKITDAVSAASTALGIFEKPVLEHPAELSHGDYSTNVALVVAKKRGENPKALAEKIVTELGAIDGVEKIDVAGAGFINFHLSRSVFAEGIQEILSAGEKWGRNDFLSGKKIIVEYSQPNPFKPFHIGHLMSTTVGESISRLVEWSGSDIRRMNYQGDIGPHVAKCLWGVMKNGSDPKSIAALGEAYVRGATAYEDDAHAKKEIDDINKRLYAGDVELQPLYDAGRKASLDHFDELYAILGTRFDDSIFESEVWKRGIAIVMDGLMRGVFAESDGAVVFKGEKVGLHTRVFITSQKNPTYEAKELGLIEKKLERFPFDLNITTVAVEQESYFRVVEAAMAELWPKTAGTYTHRAFGMLQMTTGKMSSRKGNVITGESLIEDMRAKAMAKMEGRELGDAKQATADTVAVGAIKYSILKQNAGKNIIFDPEQSLSFEGDSGPYLQYSHVRARSVLEKAHTSHLTPQISNPPEEVTELERLLYRFPEVVVRAQKEYEPHYVTTFLTDIAGAFNSWYAQEQIVNKDDPASPYKIALTKAFAQTMKNGLWLLGIQAPEKM